MARLDYEFFLNLLKTNGSWLDETHFYFVDDPGQREHWLGCIPKREKPYWLSDCDVPGGAEYDTAEEMAEAPVLNGKSLRERWPQVRVLGTMGLCLEDWQELYGKYGGGPSPRSGPVDI